MAVDGDLPQSYKVRPDTEQLLVHNLRPKLDGEDFPQGLVPLCDLYGNKEPWQIWNDYFQELSAKDKERTGLYFITQHKTKTPRARGKRINRTVDSGTWKGEDPPKGVLAASSRTVIGKRRRFRHENKEESEQMHEFELDASVLRNKRKAKDYGLCILRKKSRSVKKNSEDQDDQEEDDMSCDASDDHEQDGDLPEPELFEEETSTTTQKLDEHTPKTAVESEVYLQQQIAGQAMEKNDHEGSQESDELRKCVMEIEVYIEKRIAGQAMKKIDHNDLKKSDELRTWAMEFEVGLMKQNARDQAKKKNDHKDSQTVSLEEMENYLMSDD
ncbi:hypothetical protein ACLB2K_028773 [Fragaria x ananassa]